MTAYTINLDPVVTMTSEQFYQLCRVNPGLKFERTSKGELIIMPPAGGEAGKHNFDIGLELGLWNRQAQLGVCFDSSTCFQLPNGGDRSPDLAWIRQDRWAALTPEQKEKFPPIAPDFVLKLMSPTDRLKDTQVKMQEYMSSGVKLGWLINRKTRTVEIYRLGKETELIESPVTLSGEDILPGFILDMRSVW
jgi:Uma2 family endonuclease